MIFHGIFTSKLKSVDKTPRTLKHNVVFPFGYYYKKNIAN